MTIREGRPAVSPENIDDTAESNQAQIQQQLLLQCTYTIASPAAAQGIAALCLRLWLVVNSAQMLTLPSSMLSQTASSRQHATVQ